MLSLIHTLRSSLQHALSPLSLLCVHWLSPANDVASTASAFTSLLADSYLTTNSAFLHSNLQQWKLLASHTSRRDNCLMTALLLDWSVCLWTPSRLSTQTDPPIQSSKLLLGLTNTVFLDVGTHGHVLSVLLHILK
jgi:hypothetical protein